MKTFIILSLLISSFGIHAETKKAQVRYEYKKFEKFDFDEIGVEGESGSPGDLSISPRVRTEFKNRLPERQDFNKEMRKSIEGIR